MLGQQWERCRVMVGIPSHRNYETRCKVHKVPLGSTVRAPPASISKCLRNMNSKRLAGSLYRSIKQSDDEVSPDAEIERETSCT